MVLNVSGANASVHDCCLALPRPDSNLLVAASIGCQPCLDADLADRAVNMNQILNVRLRQLTTLQGGVTLPRSHIWSLLPLLPQQPCQYCSAAVNSCTQRDIGADAFRKALSTANLKQPRCKHLASEFLHHCAFGPTTDRQC